MGNTNRKPSRRKSKKSAQNEPAHIQLISNNREYLVGHIDPAGTSLLDWLTQSKVLRQGEISLVTGKEGRHEQVGCLLDIMKKKDANEWTTFLECLNKSNHEHVVNKLSGGSGEVTEKSNETSAFRDIIRDNMVYLVEKIDIKGSTLLDALVCNGVLAESQLDVIRSKLDAKSQTRHLLDIISTKGEEGRELFYQALHENDHADLAETIRKNSFPKINIEQKEKEKKEQTKDLLRTLHQRHTADTEDVTKK